MESIERSIELNASPETVYAFLIRFEDYPRFLQDLRLVRRSGALRLKWQSGHGDGLRESEAEIEQQIPGRRIALHAVGTPYYEISAELQPAAENRTRLSVRLACEASALGASRPDLGARLEQDLARLKKELEPHDPAGVHAWPGRMVEPAGAGSFAGAAPRAQDGQFGGTADTDGATVGKTIGQTASERAEAGRSEAPSEAAGRPRREPWRRASRSLDELWERWEQQLGLVRRVTGEVGRGVGRVIGNLGANLNPESRHAQDEGARHADASRPSRGAWTPAIETAQRESKFVVCAELPGVRGEDVQVEVKHDRVTIEGERHAEPVHEPREQRHSERCYGHFYRVVNLPPGARPDAAQAQLHDGVLEITVPLDATASQARRLEIRRV